MARSIWQKTITNETGDIQDGVQITVNVQGGGLAAIYDNQSGGTVKANPFLTGANGVAKFFAEPGFYEVTAFKNGETATFEWNNIGDSRVREDLADPAIDVPIVDDNGDSVVELRKQQGFAGTFESGFTITSSNQFVLFGNSSAEQGFVFKWNGALPKTVTAGSTPSGTGGIYPSGDWVDVGQAALRIELSSDDGYRMVANSMAPNAYGIPGKLTSVTESTVSIKPVGFFDGFLWGVDSSKRLHESNNMGASWTLVSSVVNRGVEQLLKASDGEVLAQDASGISKSNGFSADPSTATWSTVLSRPSGNVADFLKWGFDGDGQRFIATHYSSTREDSRYVWISIDAGSTWTIKYDSNERDPAVGPTSHLHAACYDPWSGRFYFTEGHEEPVVGIYYSDDDGDNWTQMTNDLDMSPAFTTMKATDFGIVCGTDGPPNGVFLIRRSADPDDVGVEFMGDWQALTSREGIIGFANHSFRDPDTGIVYVGFGNAGGAYSEVPNVIFAVGASGAEIAYQGAASRVYSVFAAKGRIVAQIGAGSTTWLSADTSKYGATPKIDRGNLGIGYGDYTRNSSMRAGRGSEASGLESMSVGIDSSATSQRTTALGRGSNASADSSLSVGYGANSSSAFSISFGYNAKAIGFRSISIGADASSASTDGVAVGDAAQAAQGIAIGARAESISSPKSIAVGENSSADGGVAIGLGATVSGALAVAVGSGAKATTTGSTAYGDGAEATGVDTTSVGRDSTASGTDATSIGKSASAITNGTSIGRGANAAHLGSVALGRNSATQRQNSVCLGNRDIESTKNGAGLYLKSPDGTLFLVTVTNGGALDVSAV